MGAGPSTLNSPSNLNVSGAHVGRMVLPAQARKLDEAQQARHQAAISELIFEGADVTSELFTTKNQFKMEMQTIVPSTGAQKCIIYFCGNGEFFQDKHEEMVRDMEAHDCAVVGFNYPNVGNSEGEPMRWNDLVNSSIEVVKHAMAQLELRSCDIIFKTQSLGGAIGTYVASKLHKENEEVFLFNGRSFANINKTISGLIGLPETLAVVGTSLSGWNAHPGNEYASIPDEFKTFVTAELDQVIPRPSSILDDQKARGGNASELEHHHLLKDTAGFIRDHHNCPLTELVNGEGKNGEEIFDEFVEHAFALRPTASVGPK